MGAGLIDMAPLLREECAGEDALQRAWSAGQYGELTTTDGRRIRVLAPGRWNHGEGPDFRDAHLEINGRQRRGDVELHLDAGGWYAHGHHEDRRYNGVILHVVRSGAERARQAVTAAGRPLPTAQVVAPTYGAARAERPGRRCARVPDSERARRALVGMAGDWRAQFQAERLAEAIGVRGTEEALYGRLLEAFGFGPYREAFRRLATVVPYARARQWALTEPDLLEAAYLHVCGLLPGAWPGVDEPPAHFERLDFLRRTHLEALRAGTIAIPRAATRPANRAERRLAAAAAFVTATAAEGLDGTIRRIWHEDLTARARIRAFLGLFPVRHGYWARHSRWAGAEAARATALLGLGRCRGIVGNVWTPFGFALAAERGDGDLEAAVWALYEALPAESTNRVVERTANRLFPEGLTPKTFREQQGLLQLNHFWCGPNPSCRECRLLPYVESASRS